ncbi:hypothetical protein Q7C_1556 [Methylophaga frappieri]|uniref:Uncharacterized protein n=1 Tax=Methylophaga frappieri (strain ATCC BAA-2434 / DSM 25690 / JAM7) TaxID=754477 RepID=I1YIG2_METFJ|nr:hypothetical protein Q7C_1556 [Methylophaga frappieri]
MVKFTTFKGPLIKKCYHIEYIADFRGTLDEKDSVTFY